MKRVVRDRMILASLLALLLALLEGLGGPPSEFAPKDSMWWTLNPLMWPALFGGVVLAVVALIASVASQVRGAAIVCFVAALSTASGVVVAAGVSDHRALTFYAVNVAPVAVPAAVAVSVLTRAKPR